MNIDIDIEIETLNEWQSILELLCQLINVPTALIMKLEDKYIKVLASSKTEGNPYKIGDKEVFENSGLYCETVIKTKKPLLIPNALKDPVWKDNPDISLNMISYLGYPVFYPDGKPFGTICLLDNKTNYYSKVFMDLMEKFRNFIQNNIRLMHLKNEMEKLAITDSLTLINNRRKILELLNNEIERSLRFQQKLSVLMLDIDDFKAVNDTYGHQAGDIILKEFVKVLNYEKRQIDHIGRLGGDEFIVILPGTSRNGSENFIKRIYSKCKNKKIPKLNFSTGIRIINNPKESKMEVDMILAEADKALYPDIAEKFRA